MNKRIATQVTSCVVVVWLCPKFLMIMSAPFVSCCTRFIANFVGVGLKEKLQVVIDLTKSAYRDN
jgi:hypothetical protein